MTSPRRALSPPLCPRGHDDKVRVILNKADQVDAQQLMRVYGALMWSLGKVFNTPEVVKVYVGSFNAKNQGADGAQNQWANNPLGAMLFEKEQQDLLNDLYAVPSRSTDRKVNEFVKRVRAARTHMLIVGSLRKQMPQARVRGPAPPSRHAAGVQLRHSVAVPRASRARRSATVPAPVLALPQVFGHDEKQKKLLGRLEVEFEKCQARWGCAPRCALL